MMDGEVNFDIKRRQIAAFLRCPEGSPRIRPALDLSLQHGPVRSKCKYLVANLHEPAGNHRSVRAKVIPLANPVPLPGVDDHHSGTVKPVPPAIGILVPVIAYRLACVSVIISPGPGLLDPAGFLFRLCDDTPVWDPVPQNLTVVFAVGLPAWCDRWPLVKNITAPGSGVWLHRPAFLNCATPVGQ